MRLPHFYLRDLCLAACTAVALNATANDIQVTNVDLLTAGQPAGQALVNFDVSWQNSWRTSFVNNWDAAWVFVKYRSVGNVWNHVYLANIGHTATSTPGNTIATGRVDENTAYDPVTNPVVGVFIHRTFLGFGTFNVTDVRLRWNYAAQGLLLSDIQEIKVFALEMVYVPQGAFAAGSGGTETNAFTLTTINTADASVVPTGAGGFFGSAQGGHPSGSSGGYTPPNEPNFPNGYEAFYCMKYEVSQQGYVDYLNTLTYEQQDANTFVPPDTSAGTVVMAFDYHPRRAIRIAVPGVAGSSPALYGCDLNNNGVFGEPADGMDLACPDLLCFSNCRLPGYLTWCGLRVMTELEYEKACRGTAPPFPNEYAWGNTSITSAPYTLSDAGTRDEGIASNFSTSAGNANTGDTGPVEDGPLRVGIFAAQPGSTDRVAAGASYWGIMELTGNMAESVIAVRFTSAFTGYHGNGNINSAAPSAYSYVSTRGGGYLGTVMDDLRVSDRRQAGSSLNATSTETGGRGVRSAP